MERPKKKILYNDANNRVFFNWHQYAEELEKYADSLEGKIKKFKKIENIAWEGAKQWSDKSIQAIHNEIDAEIGRSNKIHGEMPDDIFIQLAIMLEEAGEVAKAVNDYKFANADKADIRTELIQTAAMCVKMINKL